MLGIGQKYQIVCKTDILDLTIFSCRKVSKRYNIVIIKSSPKKNTFETTPPTVKKDEVIKIPSPLP